MNHSDVQAHFEISCEMFGTTQFVTIQLPSKKLLFKNSLIIYEENTKEITTVAVYL